MTTTEWPPRSGRQIEIPEIDRAEFFTLDDAREAINVAQEELLDRLEAPALNGARQEHLALQPT